MGIFQVGIFRVGVFLIPLYLYISFFILILQTAEEKKFCLLSHEYEMCLLKLVIIQNLFFFVNNKYTLRNKIMLQRKNIKENEIFSAIILKI